VCDKTESEINVTTGMVLLTMTETSDDVSNVSTGAAFGLSTSILTVTGVDVNPSASAVTSKVYVPVCEMFPVMVSVFPDTDCESPDGKFVIANSASMSEVMLMLRMAEPASMVCVTLLDVNTGAWSVFTSTDTGRASDD